jgi:ATP-dependent HslUV protease ATP-binding subunit HslU
MPNNIIMIGPTGVGKTEIARRLARLAGAPFVKVEASKFTEVGYVGRDVESMIRDLVDVAVNLVRNEREEDVRRSPSSASRSGCSICCCPADRSTGARRRAAHRPPLLPRAFVVAPSAGQIEERHESRNDEEGRTEEREARERRERTREKLRACSATRSWRSARSRSRSSSPPHREHDGADGRHGGDGLQLHRDAAGPPAQANEAPQVTVAEARRILLQDELDKLVNMDEVVARRSTGPRRAGIVFLDEIDKIAGERGGAGPDVSREGVQRDLLPIVEGSTVQTKYGMVRTDHVLFVAAGAFHVSQAVRPDPRAAGSLPDPRRAEEPDRGDFVRILQEPKNALLTQYQALVAAEGATLSFTDDGVRRSPHRGHAQRPDGEHRRAPAAHRAHHAPRGDPLRPPRRRHRTHRDRRPGGARPP